MYQSEIIISHGNGIFEKAWGHKVQWYKVDKLHREDAPAVYYFKSKQEEWYLNGERHREDGPAIIWGNGKKEWYLNGKELSEKEFNIFLLQKQLQNEIPINNQHVKTKKTKI
jgi:hypothetical protein